ncbi:MAG TPA: recombination protein RecR [Candidatus Cryptobacteroides merdipullorum]|uniref:Recombination protein RecR n=1 Tax=Candidatus Cryptobacteroides merdipullorum TaxID=2840771 RepID=A0A9D1KJ11_9BACT|nr:recombination protein RecR [Candidatus Cryptobacteroides merdipullorum]
MTGKYPSKSFKDAVEAISSLPGVGSRGALRLVLHLLRQPAENVHHLAEAISGLADDVHYCKTCMMVSDGDSCSICSDPKRDHSTICVVENVRDVMRIEETGQYHGVYHVLGGIISPINGIGPSDITVRELVERLRGLSGQAEVIFALSGSVEGETTAFYIYRQIEGLGVKVSTLARGLSFGADLEYADSLTLGRSIIDRQVFKP